MVFLQTFSNWGLFGTVRTHKTTVCSSRKLGNVTGSQICHCSSSQVFREHLLTTKAQATQDWRSLRLQSCPSLRGNHRYKLGCISPGAQEVLFNQCPHCTYCSIASFPPTSCFTCPSISDRSFCASDLLPASKEMSLIREQTSDSVTYCSVLSVQGRRGHITLS